MRVAYLDYDVKEHIPNNSEFGTFLRKIMDLPKSLTKVYNLRNEILYNIFSSEAYLLAQNIKSNQTKQNGKTKIHIDCFTGLAGFFSQLDVASYIEHGTCNCGQIRTSQFPLIPLKPQDLTKIQNNIIFHEKEKSCPVCQRPFTISKIFKNVLAFEVEPPENILNIIAIDDIQNMITLQNTRFELFGIIEFVPGIEHFVAYVQRKDGVWEQYDDMRKGNVKRVDPATENMNAFMLFYVKKSE